MANGSPLPLPGSWSRTLSPHLPIPSATFAQISVTMAWTAPCTPVHSVVKWPWDMLHIIVWKSNVISVIDGDIPTMYATFKSMEDVMAKGMWWITIQSTLCLNQQLTALMGEPTWRMTISTPLWMMNERLRYVEPGARMYKGGNITIFFLFHVFFLIAVVCHPYFHFAPQYEETEHYLLAFPHSSCPLFILL